MKTRKTNSLLILFIIVFFDMLGMGIIFPILAPLLLDPQNLLLPPSTDQALRTIILGLIFAIYPLTQFFGAPILGALSDHYGRKKILIISLAGTFLGYLIFALGVITHNIWLLFFSRAIDGFTGGNIAVAQSSIADLSDNKTKAGNFGMIGMAFGLGFIFGPFFGGVLSDPKLVSWFNFATPFWFAAILSVMAILMVTFILPETLLTPRDTKVSIFSGIKNIRKAFTTPHLRIMFLIIFMMIFGFSFFTQFFPVYLFGKFSLDQAHIGNIFAYIGLWSALAQGLFMRPLSKKFMPRILFGLSAIGMSVALFCIILPTNVIGLLFVIPFIAIFRGINQPNSVAIISNMTTPQEQGEILGINQSITSLAHSIPPIIAGIIVSIDINSPIIAASISVLIGWIIFIFFFNPKYKDAHQ